MENKEVKVIMLPTQDKSTLYMLNAKKTLHMGEFDYCDDSNNERTNQHLYITIDEEIKEGDWFIANQGVRLCVGINKDDTQYPYMTMQDGEQINHSRHWKGKLISTTDIGLINNGLRSDTKILMSQTPKSFIEEYCEQGGIDKAYVEYEEKIIPMSSVGSMGYTESYEEVLVVNEDNTINITLTCPKKEYVKQKIYEALGYFAHKHDIIIDGNEITKWFKDNL